MLPVITAAVVAAVASPLVAWLQRPPRPAAARRGAAARGDHRDRGRGHGHDRRRASRARPAPSPATSTTPRTRSPAGSRTSASTRPRPTPPATHASSTTSDGVSALLNGVATSVDQALLARLLPRDDGAQPVLPAQATGRRSAPGPRATSACRMPVGRTITQRVLQVAARLLPRRDDRRRVQRGRGRDRRADPRRAARRDDRRGHLPRRLRPLPRRLGRGRVRGPDRARRRRAPTRPPG